MAMEDIVNGQEHSKKEYAGKGAMPLGIIGTVAGGLALLGGANGGLGGLFGGGNPATSDYVNKDQFYQTLISQQTEQANTNMAIANRFAGLEAAIAVNATANEYQNSISALRAGYESQLLESRFDNALCKATCNVVRATPMIMPSQIGESFAGTTRVLESYATTPQRVNSDCSGLRSNCIF